MPTYENVIPLSQASFSGKLPRKPRNLAVRSREYLTEAEVGKLMKAPGIPVGTVTEMRR